MASRNRRSDFQFARARHNRTSVLGHTMRLQSFSSRCLPANFGSRANRGVCLRCRAPLFRAARRIAPARDSSALESSGRQQSSFHSRQLADAARGDCAANKTGAVVAAAVLSGRVEQITCGSAARDGGSYNALRKGGASRSRGIDLARLLELTGCYFLTISAFSIMLMPSRSASFPFNVTVFPAYSAS